MIAKEDKISEKIRNFPLCDLMFRPTGVMLCVHSAERWLSGRKHRFAKPARGKPLRGFESLSLRHSFFFPLVFFYWFLLYPPGGMCYGMGGGAYLLAECVRYGGGAYLLAECVRYGRRGACPPPPTPPASGMVPVPGWVVGWAELDGRRGPVGIEPRKYEGSSRFFAERARRISAPLRRCRASTNSRGHV